MEMIFGMLVRNNVQQRFVSSSAKPVKHQVIQNINVGFGKKTSAKLGLLAGIALLFQTACNNSQKLAPIYEKIPVDSAAKIVGVKNLVMFKIYSSEQSKAYDIYQKNFPSAKKAGEFKVGVGDDKPIRFGFSLRNLLRMPKDVAEDINEMATDVINKDSFDVKTLVVKPDTSGLFIDRRNLMPNSVDANMDIYAVPKKSVPFVPAL